MTNTKTYFKENAETGNPTTEFPINIPTNTEVVSNFFLLPEKDLNSHGYFRVLEDDEPQPEIDDRTQKLTFSYKKENKKYIKKWKIIEKSIEEITEYDNEIKKLLLEYTNKKTTKLIKTGITVNNIPLDTRNIMDLFNIFNIGIVANANKSKNLNTIIKHKGSDNIVRELTNDEAIELGINLAEKIQKIHEKSWTIKNKIDVGLITTNSQIDNHFSEET
jgi:hypothetical protein